MRHLALVLLLVACSGGKGQRQDGVMIPPEQRDPLVAFEAVRSVLQHPRCQNCHPSGDSPLQGDDGREHNQNIQRGATGNGMVGAECTTCHREAPTPAEFGAHIPPGLEKGWHMPPPNMKMVFVGVTPGALCEQIKDPARNGGKDATALRTHLDDPLVKWAWTPGVGRTAPPITYEAFIAAWETWYAAGAPCPH